MKSCRLFGDTRVEITDRITKNTPSPEELEKNHNFFDPSKAEQLSLF
jgi:hypothetical protein